MKISQEGKKRAAENGCKPGTGKFITRSRNHQAAKNVTKDHGLKRKKGGRLRPDNRFRAAAETRRQRKLSPDQSDKKIKGVNGSPRLCLPCGIGTGSDPRPAKRLRQSAAFRKRSSELRCVIFIHSGGLQGHERLPRKQDIGHLVVMNDFLE
jgi:hypothetical protein